MGWFLRRFFLTKAVPLAIGRGTTAQWNISSSPLVHRPGHSTIARPRGTETIHSCQDALSLPCDDPIIDRADDLPKVFLNR